MREKRADFHHPRRDGQYPEDIRRTYPIPEFISIADVLERQGLTVRDIDGIILSHLHFDHAGGLRYFARTKALQNVMVSEAELKNAFAQVVTGQGGAYVRDTFDLPEIRWKPVEEELELAEDFRIFTERAHTPGVLGLILATLSKGAVIATSDAIYTQEAYDQGLAPGGPINKTAQEFVDNLERVKIMQAEYDATLLFGHDYDQITVWSREGSFE